MCLEAKRAGRALKDWWTNTPVIATLEKLMTRAAWAVSVEGLGLLTRHGLHRWHGANGPGVWLLVLPLLTAHNGLPYTAIFFQSGMYHRGGRELPP